jgi:hypothetical protein
MLDYGATHEIIREFLMMVMGQRACWLAEIAGRREGEWVLRTPIFEAQKLAYQEHWKEAGIIDDLSNSPHSLIDHPGLTQLINNYFSLWSDSLTDAFLNFVQTKVIVVENRNMIDVLGNFLLHAVYRFPLHRTPELLQLLDGWRWHRRQMTRLFDFRRDMLAAIYRGAEHIRL